MSFRKLFSEKKVYLLDGGMGSLLQKKGLPPGKPPEAMNLLHPEVVREVHRSYVEAGADLIETNTFGGNRLTLEKHNLAAKIKEINTVAVQMAKEAAQGSGVLVAGSVGPTGQLLAPLGELDQDQAEEAFTEQCQILKEAGVNLINIETISDLRELKSAVTAATTCGLPVMAEVTFMPNGRTLSGADPRVAVATMEGLGVTAGGINCGSGPGEIKPLLKEMALHSSLPLIVQPNAGLPEMVGDNTVYPLNADRFSALMKDLLTDTKPSIVGGCCGTTPEHIKTLRKVLDELSPVKGMGMEDRNNPLFAAGSGEGFIWSGNWDDYNYLEAEALTKEKIRTNRKIYDLFSLIQLCKDNGVKVIRLNLEYWESEPGELKDLIMELQLYFPGPLGVHGKKKELLSIFFRYYVGRPVWEETGFEGEMDTRYIPRPILYSR